MNSIVLDEIRPWFSFLSKDYGFYQVEAYNSASFGDSLAVLASDNFRIRFIRDRGQIFIDIGSVVKPDEWFDLSLVKALIEGNLADGAEAIQDLAVFLRNNYSAVKDLFEEKKFIETEKALRELEKLRAQNMFPKWVKPKL